ncbi:MAG: hypothetical protein ACYSYM_07245 [Planctomycetota bacterium]
MASETGGPYLSLSGLDYLSARETLPDDVPTKRGRSYVPSPPFFITLFLRMSS